MCYSAGNIKGYVSKSLFARHCSNTPPLGGESSRPTSSIIWWNELNREFRVWIMRSLLYLRGRWSGWRGRQRWCACVAGAGWGFGHRGSFSKDRLAWCLRDGIEPVWASRQVPLRWVFFPCSWSSFFGGPGSLLRRSEPTRTPAHGPFQIAPFNISPIVDYPHAAHKTALNTSHNAHSTIDVHKHYKISF